MTGKGCDNDAINNFRVRLYTMQQLADFVDELYRKIQYIQETIDEVEQMTEEERELHPWTVTEVYDNKHRIVAYKNIITMLEKM